MDRGQFDERLQRRGFKAIREDDPFDDGDGTLLWIKVCHEGCNRVEQRMDPATYDPAQLELLFDDIVAHDCEHGRWLSAAPDA